VAEIAKSWKLDGIHLLLSRLLKEEEYMHAHV